MVQAQRALVAVDAELPDADRADAVVRPISRAAERACARPACPSPARATLRFAYDDKQVVIGALSEVTDPQAYDLCSVHASRSRPPYGWKLRDTRSDEERQPDTPLARPSDLGSERTVAVLAAALRAVPTSVPEHEGGPSQVSEVAGMGTGVAASGGGPPVRSATAAVDTRDGPCLDVGCGDAAADDGSRASEASIDEIETRSDLAMQGFAVRDDDGQASLLADDDEMPAAHVSPRRIVRVSAAASASEHSGGPGFARTW
ncbi:MAG: DUF3499 family protein [Nitriliruptoraceae bacterium]